MNRAAGSSPEFSTRPRALSPRLSSPPTQVPRGLVWSCVGRAVFCVATCTRVLCGHFCVAVCTLCSMWPSVWPFRRWAKGCVLCGRVHPVWPCSAWPFLRAKHCVLCGQVYPVASPPQRVRPFHISGARGESREPGESRGESRGARFSRGDGSATCARNSIRRWGDLRRVRPFTPELAVRRRGKGYYAQKSARNSARAGGRGWGGVARPVLGRAPTWLARPPRKPEPL